MDSNAKRPRINDTTNEIIGYCKHAHNASVYQAYDPQLFGGVEALKVLHSTMNEGYSILIAADVILMERRFGYCGLVILLKNRGMKPSARQMECLDLLLGLGYATAILPNNFLEAKQFIDKYMSPVCTPDRSFLPPLTKRIKTTAVSGEHVSDFCERVRFGHFFGDENSGWSSRNLSILALAISKWFRGAFPVIKDPLIFTGHKKENIKILILMPFAPFSAIAFTHAMYKPPECGDRDVVTICNGSVMMVYCRNMRQILSSIKQYAN